MVGDSVRTVGKVNVTYDVSQQLASDILITAFDAGYGATNYWADNVSVVQSDAPDILDRIWYSATFRDFEGGSTLGVTHVDIVRAIQMVLAEGGQITPSIPDSIRRAVAENDGGYIDADCADVIVQLAVFNEIVYG